MPLPHDIQSNTVARAIEVRENFEYLDTELFGRLRYLGAHNTGTAYLEHDAVDSGGSMWIALVGNTNVTPVEGATWHKIGGTATVADASTAVKGVSRLSTAPADAANPIAAGTNDSRMTNARTPTAHASTHTNGTDDIQTATDSVKGLLSAADHTSYSAHVAAAAPHSGHLKADGTVAMAANLDLGGFNAINSTTPSAGNHLVNKTYADALATGISLKASVKVATTANITLSGAQTIDSVAVVAGDRVLVKNQTTGSENGIYIAAAGAWTRATDADTDAEMPAGTSTFVEYGTAHQKQRWTMITPSVVVGTTAQSWTQDAALSSSGSTSANGNTEGVGVHDSLSGSVDYFRGIFSTNTFITVALNAGAKSIRLTLNEALLSLNNLLGTLLATKGGTGHATTTLGDLLHGAAANTWAKLTGNTTTTPKYLRQTGDGTNSAAPEWVGPIPGSDMAIMGASGAGHAPGAVPDTPGTAGISKYLREDGTWVNPSIAAGAGDMVKSVYDTDNDGIVDAAETAPWAGVTGKPSTFAPSAHASSHASGGADPLTITNLVAGAGLTTGHVLTATGATTAAFQAASGGGGGGTAINEVWLMG